MSKSAIYTVNNTLTSVADGGVIPLGQTIRRFGCNINQDGNTVNLCGTGYYKIDLTAVLEPTAAGDVSVSLYKDGVEVIGATSIITVAVAGDSVTLPFSAIVRNSCDCGSSVLSFVLGETPANITNFAVTVEKL